MSYLFVFYLNFTATYVSTLSPLDKFRTTQQQNFLWAFNVFITQTVSFLNPPAWYVLKSVFLTMFSTCCLSVQVCRKLGIIEVDYFGLQFTGGKGENLWLNLRNRICQQMDNVTPCRLRLRVKFFVEPHLILQEQTRYIPQLMYFGNNL